MKESDKILDLLLKGANNSLTIEETSYLRDSMNLEEIEDFTALLHSYLKEQESIEPNLKIKEDLLLHFQEKKQKSTVIKNIWPLLIKLSAAAILILALGISIFSLFPSAENTTLDEDTIDLIDMEFSEFAKTEVQKVQAKEELKEETKYLLHVDFFSNSSLFGR